MPENTLGKLETPQAWQEQFDYAAAYGLNPRLRIHALELFLTTCKRQPDVPLERLRYRERPLDASALEQLKREVYTTATIDAWEKANESDNNEALTHLKRLREYIWRGALEPVEFAGIHIGRSSEIPVSADIDQREITVCDRLVLTAWENFFLHWTGGPLEKKSTDVLEVMLHHIVTCCAFAKHAQAVYDASTEKDPALSRSLTELHLKSDSLENMELYREKVARILAGRYYEKIRELSGSSSGESEPLILKYIKLLQGVADQAGKRVEDFGLGASLDNLRLLVSAPINTTHRTPITRESSF